jgi:hypothetical protein
VLRRRLLAGLIWLAAVGALVSGCGGGQKTSAPPPTSSTTSTTISPAEVAGNALLGLIIQAPEGFTADSTSGATGAVTPQVFTQYGGADSAAKEGFVAGYKQNYVDEENPDGLAITVFEFRSPANASSYFKQTEPKTLSLSAPTITSYPQIPGAISAAGTKAYGGEWADGIAYAIKQYYVSVFWVQQSQGPPPVELETWSKAQWIQIDEA